jgi:hypothetical protein
MDQALKSALRQPDLDDILLTALDHADITMRRYIWRGFRPKAGSDKELIVGDKTAKDFVNEAIRRLCEWRRKYDPQKSLLENLNSITDSLIWSDKKSSDRTGILDFADRPDTREGMDDPISAMASSETAPDGAIIAQERIQTQRQCFQLLKAAFDGDKPTQDYLDALSEGFFDIGDISQLIGIAEENIYEIRRKLKNFAPKFFGVPNYQALERKIHEG